MITHDKLKALLHYDPNTGLFTWIKHRTGTATAGKIAGYSCEGGYRRLRIFGRNYRINRLAWFYMTGEWPKGQIDHKDRDRTNNKWENLRDVTPLENSKNRSVSLGDIRLRTNKNKRVGVTIDLGWFLSKEEALAAANSALTFKGF